MKRNYYLRGLGLGILITAIVFIIAGPKELSDEDIIQRAEELGYVKETGSSLGIKDLLNKETPAPTQPIHTVEIPGAEKTPVPTPTEEPVTNETPVPTPTEQPEEVPTPTLEPTPVPTVSATPVPTSTPVPTNTPTPMPTVTSTPTKAPEQGVTATIVVSPGNSATMVCRQMQEKGIVKDGNDFRNYLVKNNLTDYINIGTYVMSSNMSYKELANMLTGR